jgi:hypothetical protein
LPSPSPLIADDFTDEITTSYAEENVVLTGSVSLED